MAKQIRCCLCETVLSKDEIGLNRKLLGDRSKTSFCLNCLAVHLDATVADLLEKIEDFKNEGCKLFL